MNTQDTPTVLSVYPETGFKDAQLAEKKIAIMCTKLGIRYVICDIEYKFTLYNVTPQQLTMLLLTDALEHYRITNSLLIFTLAGAFELYGIDKDAACTVGE